MTSKVHWKVCRRCGTECNCEYFRLKAKMQEDFEYYFNNIRKDFIYEIRHYLNRFENKDELRKDDQESKCKVFKEID